MNSENKQQNQKRLRKIRATTFGIYDPQSLSISFHNMQSLIKAADEDEEHALNWAMQRENAHRLENNRFNSVKEFRNQVISGKFTPNLTDEEWEEYNRMKERHYQMFDFYYRMRVHEKNHWYTHISSVVPISRFLSGEDHKYALWQQLEELNSETIYLPLLRWSHQKDCPEKLSNIVLSYHINSLVNMSFDGDLTGQKDWHILSAFYPELVSSDNFWEKPSYRIGNRALIEGSGKASEWLYSLRKNSSVEKRAWEDIHESPQIYKIALEQLIEVMPGRSLLEYLQIFSVLVEFAINPFPDEQSWPVLSGDGVSADDTLPGLRYQRLLDLLTPTVSFDPYSKQSITNFLIKETNKSYGWASPTEIAIQLLKLLEKSVFIPENETDDAIFWNPLETIKMALKVKSIDPLAYVAPVNAQLINASKTYQQLEITSPGFFAGNDSAMFTYVFMWYQDALLESLVYSSESYCPCSENEWFAHLVANMGLCEQSILSNNKEETSVKSEFKLLENCNWFKKFMKSRFGDILNRICYLKTKEK